MAIIVKNFTFSAGAVIVAAQHNSNFDTVYDEFNGSIDNDNIKAGAAIVDSKLAQITTAAKVSGAALTSLTSIPAQDVNIRGVVDVTGSSLIYNTSTGISALAIHQTGSLATGKYIMYVDNDTNPADGSGLCLRFDGCGVTNANIACAFTANTGPNGAQTTIQGWLGVVIDGTASGMPYW